MFSSALAKTLLFSSACAFTAGSLPAPLHDPLAVLLHRGTLSRALQGLEKTRATAKTAALEWKQTGSTLYDYNSFHLIDTTTWVLARRDTSMYDTYGNNVLSKTSTAHSGWNTDSLQETDSSVYVIRRLSEEYVTYADPAVSGGNTHTVMSYINGGTSVVETMFDWDSSTGAWQETQTDSMVFSKPMDDFNTTDSMLDVFHYLIAAYISMPYDSYGSGYTFTATLTRIDTECTPTTLVYEERADLGTGPMMFARVIMSFRSTDWVNSNMASEITQEKTTEGGTYINNSRDDYPAAANGYRTGDYQYDWDTVQQVWVPAYASINLPDSHGNDTLEFSCDGNINALTWDTSSWYRYGLRYDADFKLLEDTTYSSNGTGTPWITQDRIVYKYSLINAPVARLPQAMPMRHTAMTATPARIRFSGCDITGVDVYNTAGRLVIAARQPAAPSLTIDRSNTAGIFAPGTYIARLIDRTSGAVSLRFTIR